MNNNKGFSAFMATLMAIVIGLIFGFLVMLIASPANASLGFMSVLTGGLKNIGDVFYYATPILMTGLSLVLGCRILGNVYVVLPYFSPFYFLIFN